MSEAARQLARILFEEMERLDPGCCGGGLWDDLPQRDMAFYVSCVEKLLENDDLIARAQRND